MHTEDDVKALAARFGTTEVYCRNLKKQVPLDIITDYVSIFTLARMALAFKTADEEYLNAEVERLEIEVGKLRRDKNPYG